MSLTRDVNPSHAADVPHTVDVIRYREDNT
jgi:hypothetical protein